MPKFSNEYVNVSPSASESLAATEPLTRTRLRYTVNASLVCDRRVVDTFELDALPTLQLNADRVELDERLAGSDLEERAKLVKAQTVGLDRADLGAELGLEGRVLALGQLDGERVDAETAVELGEI